MIISTCRCCSLAGSLTLVSGEVSQWNDRSANGYHLTSTDRPLYGDRRVNGITVPDFSSNAMDNASFPNAAPLSILFVGQNDTTGAVRVISGASTAGAQPLIRWAAGNVLTALRESNGNGYTSTIPIVADKVYSIAALVDTSTATLFRDGIRRVEHTGRF